MNNTRICRLCGEKNIYFVFTGLQKRVMLHNAIGETLFASKRSPYHVNELIFEDFWHKVAAKKVTTSTWTKLKWKWSDKEIKILRVESDHSRACFYKTSYRNEIFKEINMCNRKTKRSQDDLNSIELVLAYSFKIPLSGDTKKNLIPS